MNLQSYADAFSEGLRFLMALGSIIGILVLIAGLLGFLLMPKYKRNSMCLVVVFGVVLVMLCGITTGLEYFGVRI
jgi:uncharacterized membrane protein